MSRVVLFHGPNQPLEVANFAVPAPRGAEVLVRITCCTLCTSDLHTHAGRRHGPTPTVLGHEIVGRIAAFGPDAARSDGRGRALNEGDRITWTVTAGCGGCFFCADGMPQKCDRLVKYGHERLSTERPFVGGLAEYIVLAPGTVYYSVAEQISDALAAPVNCATATCAAVVCAGGNVHGRTLLIFGAGVLGLTACAMARTAGAANVLVCDRDPVRRARASEFGATHVLSADAADLATGIAAATQGRGADVALELAGTHGAVAASLASVRIGGTVVLAGTVLPTPAVPLDPEMVVRRWLTIRGVHNYAPRDLATALDFLADHGHEFPFAKLAGPTFRLNDIEHAFAQAHANPGSRVAVVP